ncbi:uncharacterized protein B0P05DRAFT_559523 [Gilbertella persicaria]|uniref:Pentatricopeptide repeat-containing protein-mitochondrial domain-containing protein n=1 Tax=Rhizopus stolonifer TaxID=4846 RepID=A0A367KV36_RHIST|nr:uncharacterized protein B0P05DRAFT_559523 [Gilbertella persicaria]KAI8058706.1 hypothetical protein B0P05DRAFT_559523 [Gilbertella persicaria]RCI06073.1 hypothetical protein CU098_004321 [Rhizopus stolonifer]
MNRLLFSEIKARSHWAVNNSKFVRFNSTEALENNVSKKIVLQSHPTAPLSAFNYRLVSQLRKNRDPKKNLNDVLKIVDEIKAQNLQFNQLTYSAILTAYSRARDRKSVLNTLNEMKENGMTPLLDSYNITLEAFANAGDIKTLESLKQEIKEKGLELTATSYQHLLKGLCNARKLNHALNVLEEMKTAGIQPSLKCYSIIITACLQLSKAKVAFDMLKQAEEAGFPVESEPRIYMDVMRVGADEDEIDVIKYCWDKAIGTYSLRPDEGTLLNVLRVAGKVGDTKLATDIIRQLSTSGYPYKEHYFTPLMEAFIAKNDLKSAFNVLDIMRLSGIPPTMRATLPIRSKLDKDVEAIDKAYYLLEEMKKENKTIDISAFNTVIAACADAKDLNRTIATYREASNLGVVPNIDTYNCVLDACIHTRMKGMGHIVIEEMKKAEITPNLDTYSKMMALACTQKNYEDAFVYLEEMKSYDIVPPETCYRNLAQKLAYEKDPRFHMVLEEMETFGYKVTPKVRALWKSK